MGNIMAPSYSGIFMGELEKKLIEPGADKIKLWVHYIDDIFVVWQGPQTDFEHLVQQCNKLHPTIKFTSECSATEINFLDMTIYFQTKHTLDIKTYTKPTNTQAYVHASSFHPGGVGKSIALGESYRALRTNTDKVDFLQQIHNIQNALLSRGYDEKNHQTVDQTCTIQRQTRNHTQKQTDRDTNTRFTDNGTNYNLQYPCIPISNGAKLDLDGCPKESISKQALPDAPPYCIKKEPVTEQHASLSKTKKPDPKKRTTRQPTI